MLENRKLIALIMKYEVSFSSCGYWEATTKNDSDPNAEGVGIDSFLSWIKKKLDS